MGRECRYCVDHTLAFVREIAEAIREVRVDPKIANDKILVAQDYLSELVKSECLSHAVASPISDDLAVAFTETDLKKKVATLENALRIYHYDLATDVAEACQRGKA